MPVAADLCDFCLRLHIYLLVLITSCKALSKLERTCVGNYFYNGLDNANSDPKQAAVGH